MVVCSSVVNVAGVESVRCTNAFLLAHAFVGSIFFGFCIGVTRSYAHSLPLSLTYDRPLFFCRSFFRLQALAFIGIRITRTYMSNVINRVTTKCTQKHIDTPYTNWKCIQTCRNVTPKICKWQTCNISAWAVFTNGKKCISLGVWCLLHVHVLINVSISEVFSESVREPRQRERARARGEGDAFHRIELYGIHRM